MEEQLKEALLQLTDQDPDHVEKDPSFMEFSQNWNSVQKIQYETKMNDINNKKKQESKKIIQKDIPEQNNLFDVKFKHRRDKFKAKIDFRNYYVNEAKEEALRLSKLLKEQQKEQEKKNRAAKNENCLGGKFGKSDGIYRDHYLFVNHQKVKQSLKNRPQPIFKNASKMDKKFNSKLKRRKEMLNRLSRAELRKQIQVLERSMNLIHPNNRPRKIKTVFRVESVDVTHSHVDDSRFVRPPEKAIREVKQMISSLERSKKFPSRRTYLRKLASLKSRRTDYARNSWASIVGYLDFKSFEPDLNNKSDVYSHYRTWGNMVKKKQKSLMRRLRTARQVKIARTRNLALRTKSLESSRILMSKKSNREFWTNFDEFLKNGYVIKKKKSRPQSTMIEAKDKPSKFRVEKEKMKSSREHRSTLPQNSGIVKKVSLRMVRLSQNSSKKLLETARRSRSPLVEKSARKKTPQKITKKPSQSAAFSDQTSEDESIDFESKAGQTQYSSARKRNEFALPEHDIKIRDQSLLGTKQEKEEDAVDLESHLNQSRHQKSFYSFSPFGSNAFQIVKRKNTPDDLESQRTLGHPHKNENGQLTEREREDKISEKSKENLEFLTSTSKQEPNKIVIRKRNLRSQKAKRRSLKGSKLIKTDQGFHQKAPVDKKRQKFYSMLERTEKLMDSLNAQGKKTKLPRAEVTNSILERRATHLESSGYSSIEYSTSVYNRTKRRKFDRIKAEAVEQDKVKVPPFEFHELLNIKSAKLTNQNGEDIEPKNCKEGDQVKVQGKMLVDDSKVINKYWKKQKQAVKKTESRDKKAKKTRKINRWRSKTDWNKNAAKRCQ